MTNQAPLGPSSSRWRWLVPLLVIGVALYYAIGMAVSQRIDDDLSYAPDPAALKESRTVAMAAGLLFREIDQHGWVANDPFFRATWMLDNMPNFQLGIVAGVETFTEGLSNGHNPGNTSNLGLAQGLLKYSGTVWMFEPSKSWSPTISSEKQYRSAARYLLRFNTQMASAGKSIEETVPLVPLLHHLITGLTLVVEDQERQIHLGRRRLFDVHADEAFYENKGKIYAYTLLLTALGRDHANVLAERGLDKDWQEMVDALGKAARLRPLVIANGTPERGLLPNHLVTQGFYVLEGIALAKDLLETLNK